MLSTSHDGSMIEKTKRSNIGMETIKKPKMIEDYNTRKLQHSHCGVDVSNQLVL